MARRTMDEMREVAEGYSRPRRRSNKKELEGRIVRAWDEVAPWHTSRYDNLIPIWQNSIMRFGKALLGREES